MRRDTVVLIVFLTLCMGGAGWTLTAFAQSVTTFVQTSPDTARADIQVQRVTINPGATFIVLHRTLDPQAVVCIEHQNQVAPLTGLPQRTCHTLAAWLEGSR